MMVSCCFWKDGLSFSDVAGSSHLQSTVKLDYCDFFFFLAFNKIIKLQSSSRFLYWLLESLALLHYAYAFLLCLVDMYS